MTKKKVATIVAANFLMPTQWAKNSRREKHICNLREAIIYFFGSVKNLTQFKVRIATKQEKKSNSKFKSNWAVRDN